MPPEGRPGCIDESRFAATGSLLIRSFTDIDGNAGISQIGGTAGKEYAALITQQRFAVPQRYIGPADGIGITVPATEGIVRAESEGVTVDPPHRAEEGPGTHLFPANGFIGTCRDGSDIGEDLSLPGGEPYAESVNRTVEIGEDIVIRHILLASSSLSFQVVEAAGFKSLIPGLVQGGKQHRRKDGNDGDNNEKFDQRKRFLLHNIPQNYRFTQCDYL